MPILMVILLAFPGAAAASGGAPGAARATDAAAVRVRLSTSGGRSARFAHGTMAEIARKRASAPIEAPVRTPPGRGTSTTTPPGRPGPVPKRATSATIATTTTLQATPNPLTYPGQVHLVATVSPAPQGSGGLNPAVGFYVDGVFRLPAALDDMGTGSVDMSLAPGTYSVTASFGGNDGYDASTSAPVSEVVVQLPALAAETGSAAIQSSAGFPGAAGPSTVPSGDPALGVGPTGIVQMTENGARFYDHSGNPLFHLSLPDYFLIQPDQAEDPSPHGPQIVFDTLSGRWLSIQVTHDTPVGFGRVYVEISDTSDATDGFFVYRFDFPNEAPSSPTLGVTSDKVAIGFDVNVLNTGIFKGSAVMVLNMADLVAHRTTVFYERTTPDPTQHHWRPAIDLTAGDMLRAVGSGSAGTPAHILDMMATGTVTGSGTGVTFSVSDLTSGPLAVPDVGTSGAVLGPTSALWSNNHLWFVSTRTCLPTGDIFSESCVRVTELSTAGAEAVVQDFAIGTINNTNFGAGIGLAGDGSLVVVYSQAPSGPSPGPVPISTYATTQLPGDPTDSVRPSQLIDEGTPWCPGGPNCIGGSGDSSVRLAVPADPTDSHTVWEGAAISVAGGWRTWVARLRMATGAPAGTFDLAGGRPATNSLRLGIGLTPDASAAATQVLVSNSPTTSSGILAAGTLAPIGWRMPWSLADATTGGSSATGSRTVYLQWGDGRGDWSAVESQSITVDTPLGTDLVPLDPVRLLDTRSGNGLTKPFVSRVPRSFQVTGRGGVPSGAVAVTGNLTVTGQTSGGYVFLGPTASSAPTSSTLNLPMGDTRANGVTVKLGSGGRLSGVFVGSSTGKTANLIFDVSGYLLADNPNAPVGSTWVPIQPTRALDTRVSTGLAGRFHSRVPRTFCITGCVPVPDDAVAVTGNLTVTGQTTAGYVFLGPTPTNNPGSSTLNVPTHDTRANNVTVRLDAEGNLTAVFVGAASSGSTNLVFDVTGYFVRGPWGATFIPLDPARILDTRSNVGLTGPFVHQTPRSFVAAGTGGIPATGTVGVTANLTITQQTTGGFAFLGPTAAATPTSSTINVPVGDNRANGVDVGLANDGSLAAVWVGSSMPSSTAMVIDVTGYFR